jgi:hypothetical protein
MGITVRLLRSNEGTPAGRAAGLRGWEESKGSFLKKRTKKLLNGCRGLAGSVRQSNKSFLVLFFKKELLPGLSFRDRAVNG